MARRRGSETLAQAVQLTLRDWILSGTHLPGARLAPAAIAAELGSSTTVIREAMTRLAADGFVRIEPNRGFFVPQLSLDELADLTTVRCHNEQLAIRLAVERGDLEWETEIVAAHHRLLSTPRRSSADPEHITDEWSDAHRAFHHTLVRASGVELLTTLCGNLAAQTELYRRWAAPSRTARERHVEEEHTAIMEAVLARDAALAAHLLTEHYRRSVDVILQAGLVPESERIGS